MKFVDLEAEYNWFKDLLHPAIGRVLRSGTYLLGPELDQFEDEFAKYLNVKDVCGVKNCTDAITMLVKYLWKPGMPVILPNFGAYPTAVAVLAAGVNPYDLRFIDVDRTMTMDLKKLPEDLKYGIIIPVHLFGNVVSMNEIIQYATKNNHWIIEDCAQACGAGVGFQSHFSVFSFYPTKTLGCMGDGGAIATNFADDLYEFRTLRFYGQKAKYTVDVKGGVNSRLDEIQSAILRAKIPAFEELTKKRQKNSREYLEIVKGIDWSPKSVFHLFPILFKDSEARKIAQQCFAAEDIPTMVHYPTHVSEAPAIAYDGKLREPDKVGYRVSDRILSIPNHAFLTDNDLYKIKSVLEDIKELEDVS